MKLTLDFLIRNKTRLLVWLAALVATVPAGLWCGSKTWHGLNAFFAVTTLNGQFMVLVTAVVVTLAVVIVLQMVVKEAIKKLF